METQSLFTETDGYSFENSLHNDTASVGAKPTTSELKSDAKQPDDHRYQSSKGNEAMSSFALSL